jgi:hypothetical protein
MKTAGWLDVAELCRRIEVAALREVREAGVMIAPSRNASECPFYLVPPPLIRSKHFHTRLHLIKR